MNLQPTLRDDLVLLTPLHAEDFEPLYAAASDPEVWAGHPNADRWQRPIFDKFFKEALESKSAFLVRDAKTREVIGSSRFYTRPFSGDRLYIGYTFLKKSHWGGKYNASMKKLMLDHIFQFIPEIYLEIGKENIRSQIATERLGAGRANDPDYPVKQNYLYRFAADNFRYK